MFPLPSFYPSGYILARISVSATAAAETFRGRHPDQQRLLREAFPLPALVDISGIRFGRLIAVRPAGRHHGCGEVLWSVSCDCGREAIVRGSKLRQGRVKSCGCLLAGRRAERVPPRPARAGRPAARVAAPARSSPPTPRVVTNLVIGPPQPENPS